MRKITDTFITNAKSGLHRISDRRPFGRGYAAFRELAIQEVFNRIEVFRQAEQLPCGFGLGLDERIVEYPWFFSRLPQGRGRLLDAGSVLNFGYVLSNRALKEKSLFISTLAPERNCFYDIGVSYVFEDLRYSCYRDGYFDWIVSISTLEHIGLDNSKFYTKDGEKNECLPKSYFEVINEFRRIVKPNGKVFVTLPFGKHSNYGWLQVFDSEMVDGMIRHFAPQNVSECYYKYGPQGWQMSSRQACANARYIDRHKPGVYTKMDAVAAEAVVCLEMAK